METPRPKVRIFATGGTIAGVGPHRLDYTLYPELGQRLTIDQNLDRIPEVQEFAEVQGENLISVSSTDIYPDHWLQMAHRINQVFREEPDVRGVVVTHGTATLEETAYFLHLTVNSSKPVVVTGAMRPASALGTDADINLLNAIRIATSPQAVGQGVLVMLNNEIQSAREVTKTNNYRVETFKTADLGFLGYIDSDGEVIFYRSVTRKHTTATPFNVAELQALPRVDIVDVYLGADGVLMDAARQHGSEGIVLSGVGGGTLPKAMLEAGTQAVKAGVPVVLSSRVGSGRVMMTPANERAGLIVADNLLPQKARVLLMLALTITRERQEIQQMFQEY